MAIGVPRGSREDIPEPILNVLEKYQADHPNSEIAIYAQNELSFRIRIVNPAFAGKDRVERSRPVWRYLDSLPEETQSDITMLVLVTADEMPRSTANLEFEDPVHSIL